MTPTQYKAAIKALGLSQHLAGDWLGIGRRTSQGYALGEYPVPEPVAARLLIAVDLKSGMNLEALRKKWLKGLKPEDAK